MNDHMPAEGAAVQLSGLKEVQFTLNNELIALTINPAKRLLDVIRDELRLTGTKRSCEIGRCGACMVLVDGKQMNSCLLMAYQCEGKSITTIEGLHPEQGEFDCIQQAFLEEGGYQCGYCTPGMVLSVKALLDQNSSPTPDEVEEALSGNLCRCTGYGGIWRAVQRAAEMRRQSDEAG
ncbi:(2Fe-2S)-binding protein [Paenibacillus protaetiae]|uniref:(2Fe-2S)-binding protein n=1 Tax=Paenibacillus protaetiae TaxID=2509456 RepID=A0A4P6EVL1_9BACL|nr:(2Fe-2S)-binding protein [Paenibacillus protaetiae]QAY65719.1 (2Fe-2S)-binding protein [Paenibacillus protaetiae]